MLSFLFDSDAPEEKAEGGSGSFSRGSGSFSGSFSFGGSASSPSTGTREDEDDAIPDWVLKMSEAHPQPQALPPVVHPIISGGILTAEAFARLKGA